MNKEPNEMINLEDCPQCNSKLPPRLATGRVVCSKCGWTNQPKNNSNQGLAQGRPINSTSLTDLIKTRNGERFLIALGSCLITIILLSKLGFSGFQNNKSNLVSEISTPKSTNSSITASSPMPSVITPAPPSSSTSYPSITPTTSPAVPQSSTGNLPQAPSVYSIRGSLNLIDSKIGGTLNKCYGTGGFDDIGPSMPVTVRDGKGNILATGTTGTGSQPQNSEYAAVECTFKFQVDNIPKSNFYSIEVNRRGELNFSFEEMQRKNWEVNFTLG